MADDEEIRSGIAEDNGLGENADIETVRKISKYRTIANELRPESWKACLAVTGKANVLSGFDELYNLPEQNEIRDKCESIVESLDDLENRLSAVSDLEAIITFYCKSKNLSFDPNNGWLEVLKPMLTMGYSRTDLYNVFYAFLSKYTPRECKKDGKPFHLFRLLLLYHDPELCSFLDTRRITPDLYAQTWFRSMFSSCCDMEVIQSMWDVYFQHADSFLIFFLALVILVNAKDQIVGMMNDDKESILETLQALPGALEADDIEDFCSLAQYYSSKTPQSFRMDYEIPLFGSTLAVQRHELVTNVAQALCLPVVVSELLQANQSSSQSDCVRYFLIDCRPAEQYNAGHLPVAFHLDAQLMLRNPSEFSTTVQALFATQSQALATGSVAAGEHLCFIGSGRDAEDKYLHMVVSHFLQRDVRYVSIAKGGYKSLHKLLENFLSDALKEHCPKNCLECSDENGSASSMASNSNLLDDIKKEKEQASNLINKWSSALKSKSAVMKDKVTRYIKNEGNQEQPRHVSSSDKVGKRYRNMSNVFSIGDDEDEEPMVAKNKSDKSEIVKLGVWLEKPEVTKYFECQHISRQDNQSFESFLVLTESFLFVLRVISRKTNQASVQAKRPLSSIVKITSNKKRQEIITLKYGVHDEANGLVINDVDRFFIPNASQATKHIKFAIMKVLDALEVS
ncbi:DgyrCDS12119 [Dimorphilus gyrociliatus]|uniref:TBC1 domain family member 23 n=1 Tax=Dimorphilus gyrociliatus TaxID=2664684 RepID=A0A7I8W5M3_9ANNE|nr:DgyrCDS12119 [Dimorphilus gyrociliatus]